MFVATLSVPRRFGVRTFIGLLALGCLLPAGCTRRFFRTSADRQVEEVLAEKNCFEPWRIQNWYVYPDPLARFADPTNPDRPPKPFDDPSAQAFSPNPQKPGKAGEDSFEGVGYLELIRLWDAANRQEPEAAPAPTSSALPAAQAGGPAQRELLRSAERPFRIKLEQACELGLINSRSFQDARENLYLAALAVTLERFAFAAQFFVTEQVIREYVGSDLGGGNSWSASTGVTARKLFPTGALLLFRFANQVVIDMSSNAARRVSTPSTVSLDLTQPLLRGGGRAVTLEPLTQVERNLMYVIRAYARFRKLFYVFIAGGDTLGFTFPGGGFVGPGLAASDLGAATQGYLPTLLQILLLNNSRSNVAELERILTFYRQLQSGGEVSPLQSANVESQLLEGRNDVLVREQNVRDSLDRFKLQLGVPTNLPLELDDTPVRPLRGHLNRLREVFEQDREVLAQEPRLLAVPPDQLRRELEQLLTELPTIRGTRFRDNLAAAWRAWRQRPNDQIAAEIKRLDDERDALAKQRTLLENQGQSLPPAGVQRLDELEFLIDLGIFEQQLRLYEARSWERAFAEVPEAERVLRQRAYREELFRRVFVGVIRLFGAAREERLGTVQAGWPGLPKACVNGVDLVEGDFDQALAVASQTALANRLDLMNARAQLVDSWRQIAVSANSLLGVVDVQYHLDSSTPPLTGSPFDFDARRTRNQLILNGELPLVRRLERNRYRTALIAYQRQRRSLQAAEDLVLFEVRTLIRQLRVQAENYRIQQRAVLVAYSQRDNSLEVLRAPTQPGTSSAASAAALTTQLLSAQSRVPRNENLLYQFYVNYLIIRLQLFRDLELMPLDPRGVWIDEHAALDCDGPCQRPAASPQDGLQPQRQPERLGPPQPVPPAGEPPR